MKCGDARQSSHERKLIQSTTRRIGKVNIQTELVNCYCQTWSSIMGYQWQRTGSKLEPRTFPFGMSFIHGSQSAMGIPYRGKGHSYTVASQPLVFPTGNEWKWSEIPLVHSTRMHGRGPRSEHCRQGTAVPTVGVVSTARLFPFCPTYSTHFANHLEILLNGFTVTFLITE